MRGDARAELERRVRELTALGHRGSATEHEALAADYLVDELRAAGLQGAKEPFMGSSSLGARLLLHVAVSTLAVLLIWAVPAVTVVLGVAALISLFYEVSTRAVLLGWSLLRSPSQNVVATIPPAVGQVQRRIVVLAHYDTQRTGLIWRDGPLRRVEAWFARRSGIAGCPTLAVVVAMVAVPVAGGIALAWPAHGAAWVVGWVAFGILAVMCLLLADWAVGPFVPGASDNATGTAAALGLAEAWLDSPQPGVELIVLLTGCEESGLLGAAAWADRHVDELSDVPCCFLNLDGLGYGRPRFVGREYSLACEPVAYPQPYLELCAEVAAERDLVSPGPHPLPVCSDGLALLVRRMPGITLLCFDDRHLMPNYHQPTDTDDRLDFAVVWEAVGLAWAVLQRMPQVEDGA